MEYNQCFVMTVFTILNASDTLTFTKGECIIYSLKCTCSKTVTVKITLTNSIKVNAYATLSSFISGPSS